MLTGASGQSHVTGRQKKKMIQIGARQAQCSFLPSESNPSLGTKIFTTLATSRFPVRDEDLELFGPFTLQCHNLLHRFRLMLYIFVGQREEDQLRLARASIFGGPAASTSFATSFAKATASRESYGESGKLRRGKQRSEVTPWPGYGVAGRGQCGHHAG